MTFKSVRKRIKEAFGLPVRIPRNMLFVHQCAPIRGVPKIIYALTPPPRLKNIGDHAQAVAIHHWLKRHYRAMPVVEVDKDECRYYLSALRRIVEPGDLIFLHSGGNMGDRAMWSESARRLIISTFSDNRIISLPQTIYFSETPRGVTERENTRRIYATHPDLTVIGRDPESGALARELFPGAVTFSCPDFVLSLAPINARADHRREGGHHILLCLRRDDESIFTAAERESLAQKLPGEATVFDTTRPEPIEKDRRSEVLDSTLRLFASHDVVVTDRYHGVIFSVLTGVPCMVMRTVDHKLTSALSWFEGVDGVTYVESSDELHERIAGGSYSRNPDSIDWNAEYFDVLADVLAGKREPEALAPPA